MYKSRFELSKLIKKASGKSMQEYCRNVLDINEKVFYYQLRTGQVKIRYALAIMKLTKRSYKYLFERFTVPTSKNNDASKSKSNQDLFIEI